MRDKKETIMKIASVIFAVISIFSTLLLFLIPLWIVIVINSCEIVLLRIVFRGLQFSEVAGILLYLMSGILMLAVLILVIRFPTKVYGGVMQNVTDAREIYLYRDELGWCYLFFLLSYIVSGIWVIIDANNSYDVLLTFFFVKPITIMGALILFFIIQSFNQSLSYICFAYLIGVNFINILYGVLTHEDDENFPDSGSGGSGDYHIKITIEKY